MEFQTIATLPFSSRITSIKPINFEQSACGRYYLFVCYQTILVLRVKYMPNSYLDKYTMSVNRLNYPTLKENTASVPPVKSEYEIMRLLIGGNWEDLKQSSRPHCEVVKAAFSEWIPARAKGPLLAVLSTSGALHVYHSPKWELLVDLGKKFYGIHHDRIATFAWLPSSLDLLVCSRDGQLYVVLQYNHTDYTLSNALNFPLDDPKNMHFIKPMDADKNVLCVYSNGSGDLFLCQLTREGDSLEMEESVALWRENDQMLITKIETRRTANLLRIVAAKGSNLLIFTVNRRDLSDFDCKWVRIPITLITGVAFEDDAKVVVSGNDQTLYEVSLDGNPSMSPIHHDFDCRMSCTAMTRGSTGAIWMFSQIISQVCKILNLIHSQCLIIDSITQPYEHGLCKKPVQLCVATSSHTDPWTLLINNRDLTFTHVYDCLEWLRIRTVKSSKIPDEYYELMTRIETKTHELTELVYLLKLQVCLLHGPAGFSNRHPNEHKQAIIARQFYIRDIIQSIIFYNSLRQLEAKEDGPDSLSQEQLLATRNLRLYLVEFSNRDTHYDHEFLFKKLKSIYKPLIDRTRLFGIELDPDTCIMCDEHIIKKRLTCPMTHLPARCCLTNLQVHLAICMPIHYVILILSIPGEPTDRRKLPHMQCPDNRSGATE